MVFCDLGETGACIQESEDKSPRVNVSTYAECDVTPPSDDVTRTSDDVTSEWRYVPHSPLTRTLLTRSRSTTQASCSLDSSTDDRHDLEIFIIISRLDGEKIVE